MRRPAVQAELHIASLVVHAAPARVQRIEHAVQAISGACVHATTPAGKLVVTLEAASGDDLAQQVSGIQRIDGVLSATLVYQCADSLAAMNEEVRDADAAA